MSIKSERSSNTWLLSDMLPDRCFISDRAREPPIAGCSPISMTVKAGSSAVGAHTPLEETPIDEA